jgi:dihydropteroate synthase
VQHCLVGSEMCIRDRPHPLSRLDHALYLGRELQKAERCLNEGSDYVQD